MKEVETADAVLFDMDGVLLRSEEVWFRLIDAASTKFGGRPVSHQEFVDTFGQGTDADIAVFEMKCVRDELNAFYVAHFFEHADALWTNPDAFPALSGLRSLGKKIAVVTNTVSPIARTLLERSELLSLLDGLSCVDDVAHAKPAPDLVHHACRLLSVTPQQTCMVGDSRYDRMAATSAGSTFIGFKLAAPTRVDSLLALI